MAGMKQEEINKILVELLEQLIPEKMPKGEVEKLSIASGVSASAIRGARSRESLNSDTLIKLLRAHGVSADTLMNLPRNKPSKISKTLTAKK